MVLGTKPFTHFDPFYDKEALLVLLLYLLGRRLAVGKESQKMSKRVRDNTLKVTQTDSIMERHNQSLDVL